MVNRFVSSYSPTQKTNLAIAEIKTGQPFPRENKVLLRSALWHKEEPNTIITVKTLHGQRFTFAKSRLAPLSDGHLKALYVFAHILNRLKLLESQTVAYWNTALKEKEIRVKAAAAEHGVIESILLLAGELKEAGEAIQSCYYGTQLSKTIHPKLPKAAQDAFKRISRHCSGDSVIHKLRNKFSYHHSPDDILSTAKALVDDDPHTAFLFEGENNFFGFAADLRILAIANILEIDNPNKLIDYLVQVVVKEVHTDIYEALTSVLVEILSEAGVGVEDDVLPDVPSFEEIEAGYFFHVGD